MKARKKFSLILSAVLTLNLFNSSILKANAAELTNDITLKSVSVSEKLITPGSEEKVTIEASDSSSNLNKDAYAVYVSKSSGSEVEKEVVLAMDDNDKKYHASISIKDSAEVGDWKLSFVTIGDEAGNVKIFYNSNIHQEIGQDLSAGDYKVIVDNDGPKLGTITLSSNSLVQGSTLKVQMNATDDGVGLANEANLVYVIKTDKGDIEKPLTLKLNGGKYEGSLHIDETYPVGEWKLSFVTLEDRVHNVSIIYNSIVHGSELGKELSAGNFTVKPGIEAPKLISVNVDKKLVKLGDSVNVTVAANDGFALGKEANLCYVIKSDKGDIEKGITLNLKDGKYQGTLTIDNTLTSGIFSPSFVTLEDSLGNVGIVYNSKVHGDMGTELSTDMSTGDITVDMVKPDKPVIAVSTETPTNKDVDVTITTNEPQGKIEYKLGQAGWASYTGKFSVTNNTTVYARVYDLAGNVSEEITKEITNIDRIAPVITITGVDKGQVYNRPVTPVISSDDSNATITATLNGTSYDGKSPISEGGIYSLKVIATDKAGNASDKAINFTIDSTAPTIIINGVDDGKAYKADVKPEIIVNGKECTVKVLLNDKPFSSGDKITAEGSYVLKVIVTDGFGKQIPVEKKFIIDKTAPVITVEGIEDGKIYLDASVQATVKVNEDAKVTASLDEKPYNLGTSIETLGDHKLTVTAVDNAGNVSKKDIRFSLQVAIPKDAGKAAEIVKDIAAKQDKIVLNGTENPVLDAKVLEVLKGVDKLVSITVKSQGITLVWTFNGKDIKDASKSIDLSLNAVASDKDLITKVDSNAQIISFKYHGTLPAPMTITIPVDTKKFDVSKPLYFYYYNETTKKAELIADNLKAYQKGDAYFVDVTITHCSDYFLSTSDSKTVLPKVEKLVKTGSPVDMNVLLGLGILLIGAGFVVVLARRKRS